MATTSIDGPDGTLSPAVLAQLVPLSRAELPLSQRSRERAWKTGITVNGILVKLRVVRSGVRIFTLPEWCADFIVACTRAGTPVERQSAGLLRTVERERKRHTAAVLARHGIKAPGSGVP